MPSNKADLKNLALTQFAGGTDTTSEEARDYFNEDIDSNLNVAETSQQNLSGPVGLRANRMVDGQRVLNGANTGAAIIPRGTPVRVSDVTPATMIYGVDTLASEPVGLYLGVTAADIAIGATGIILRDGVMENLDTSALTADAAVFLSDSGTLTSEADQSGIRVGWCKTSDAATGVLIINFPFFADVGLTGTGIVKWDGAYTSGKEVEAFTQVNSAGWLMISNKPTSEPAAPQDDGAPTYDLPSTLPWESASQVDQFIGGHLYDFSKDGWLRRLEMWTPAESTNTPYRAVVIDVSNPSIPILFPVPVFNGGTDAWQVIQLANTIVRAGSKLQAQLVSVNSTGLNTFAYDWRYRGQALNPTAGGWARDSLNTEVEVNYLDDTGADRSADLANVIEGTKITAVNNSGSVIGSFEFLVTGTVTDTGTTYLFPVTLLTQMGSFNDDDISELTFDIPVAPTADYVRVVDHWLTPANQPSWATVSGISGDPASPVSDDNAYGVRLQFQEAVFSEDWDFQAVSLQNSTTAANPSGFVVASAASFVTQVTTTDEVPETVVFETVGNVIPEVTFDVVNGPFTLNFNGQLSGSTTLTVGRSGGGQLERLWFWGEKEIPTGSDTWVQLGSTLVRGTQLNQIDSSNFGISITDVMVGDAWRIRQEQQDASEGVGLYTEADTASHNAVASATINLEVTKL